MPADLLQIGEVAERVGLSLRTIRYYEEQDLVVPEARTEGGFRLYAEQHVDRLLLIKKMKPIGFSLDEMRAMLDARDTLADASAPTESRAVARATIAGFAAEVQRRSEKMRAALEQSEQLAHELQADL